MRYLFKYFGIITVGFCLSFWGFLKAYSKRQYIKRLEDLYSAFSRAEDMLILGIPCREKIINECFGEIEGFNTEGADLSFKPFGKFEAALKEFFSEFGGGDRQLEHNRIKRIKRELSEIISGEKNEYARLSKIWQTAGVCAGIAAGIMFI
ncbi:MAG: hypothetical protein J5852_09810 [Clostridia bacterium]|nr:hypothetical protein [Clostridia bacterium]